MIDEFLLHWMQRSIMHQTFDRRAENVQSYKWDYADRRDHMSSMVNATGLGWHSEDLPWRVGR